MGSRGGHVAIGFCEGFFVCGMASWGLTNIGVARGIGPEVGHVDVEAGVDGRSELGVGKIEIGS